MFTDLVIAISKMRKKEFKLTFLSKIPEKIQQNKNSSISYYYENLIP